MTSPVPRFALKTFARLHSRYRTLPFISKQLTGELTPPMIKKTLHTLHTNGWLERVGHGKYACKKPDLILKEIALED